jgi:hypothetical protein
MSSLKLKFQKIDKLKHIHNSFVLDETQFELCKVQS